MTFYQRNLPHWQPPEAEYFVTFRLAGSLPKVAVQKIQSLKVQKLNQNGKSPDQGIRSKINQRIFQKYEELLENSTHGPRWLDQPAIANIISTFLVYRNGTKFDLYAYCIMPNHVHLVFKLFPAKTKTDDSYPVSKLLQSLKRYTARKANQVLNRKGQFWQHESFDRVIRNQDELESTIKYVLNNPVKPPMAKLAL